MPKKRRLLNTLSSAEKNKTKVEPRDGEVWMARGRLKGALMEVLEPTAEDSDSSSTSKDNGSKAEEGGGSGARRSRSASPARQAYVLKLFDRSVDLSQFHEDSPLYPVCRAWIRNQPKANYTNFGDKEEPAEGEAVTLAPPTGAPVSRVPPLLPQQVAARNIELDYKEATAQSRESLLQAHMQRWSDVREAWLQQARRCEARHAAAQLQLNRLHVNTM